MSATVAKLDEYLDEIRKQVCTRCVERPPNGPPCVPLGVNCGVELHLRELVDSIHEVKYTYLLEPYQEHNRSQICESCAFLGSSCCPCPMDYLLVLIAQAVETVDKRIGKERLRDRDDAQPNAAGIEDVRREYEATTGTWTGCDWPTRFGQTKLDLNGCSAADARAKLAEVSDEMQAEDWGKAATWLADIERQAQEAETAAAQALAAAERGLWQKSLAHAERAWAAEFGTGRPIWRTFPASWQQFRQTIEAIFRAQETQEDGTVENHG